MNREFLLVLSIIVGVLAVARVTRLVVDDAWPPMQRAKEAYARRVSDEWLPLIECPWCVAPYVAVPAVAWFALMFRFPTWTVNNWAWWIVNGWAAVSWLASYITLPRRPAGVARLT